MRVIAEPCAGPADQAFTGRYAADCIDGGVQASRLHPGEYADCIAPEAISSGGVVIFGDNGPGGRVVTPTPTRATWPTLIHPNGTRPMSAIGSGMPRDTRLLPRA
ncbi:hypothetical protein MSTE_01295 [Mycobacteroides stephanolepidis]|uniref:Uncharacterized protein n=1 Tax=[Mycobacterium] stephanolepidis TaxID=1520670 RepID=A0A1Z4EUK1_9MYCO|nr:hypothetical protein MSTE_01295 [[Mycobacterium] stephanolepidis]